MASDHPKELLRRLQKGVVRNHQRQLFVPEDCQSDIITLRAIEQCLPLDCKDLANFAFQHARKIFAILLFNRCNIHDVLRLCQKYDMTDERLPIPDDTLSDQCAEKNCGHGPHLNIFHEADCDISWFCFYRDQWVFKGQVFKYGRFEYELAEETVMPITYGVGFGDGNFGSVREAFIHESHLHGYPDEKCPRRVAIKTFIDKGSTANRQHTKELNAKEAWEAEKRALEEMEPHPHLVERVAAVSLGNQYFLISEWADGGDLQTHWRNNRVVTPTARLIYEILVQFKGLAHALTFIHEPTNTLARRSTGDSTNTRSSSDAQTPMITLNKQDDTVSTPVDTGNDSSNWRHGDLKPANILISLHGVAFPGTLKIADLGLAKKHLYHTRHRHTPSSTEYGTQAYEPPEAVPGSRRARSRRYDTWSFGCVLMEMIVYLLYGQDGLDELWRVPVPLNQTLYWNMSDNIGMTAEVSPSIRHVMESILARDPECSQNTTICDLLLLVRDKLLVVALPANDGLDSDPSVRIDSTTLYQELEKITNKANGSDLHRS